MRLLFEGGFYSRAAFIGEFMVVTIHSSRNLLPSILSSYVCVLYFVHCLFVCLFVCFTVGPY